MVSGKRTREKSDLTLQKTDTQKNTTDKNDTQKIHIKGFRTWKDIKIKTTNLQNKGLKTKEKFRQQSKIGRIFLRKNKNRLKKRTKFYINFQ